MLVLRAKNSVLLSLFAGLFFLVACQKPNSGSSDGSTTQTREKSEVSLSKYNKLVEDYNKLLKEDNKRLETGYELYIKGRNESKTLVELDRSLDKYLDAVDSVVKTYPVAIPKGKIDDFTKDLGNVLGLYKEVYSHIYALEDHLVAEWSALYQAAPHFLQDPSKGQSNIRAIQDNLKTRSNSLTGIRRIVHDNFNTLLARYTGSAPLPEIPKASSKTIVVKSKEEKTVTSTPSKGGVSRDDKGGVIVFRDKDEVLDYATKNGFRRDTTIDAYDMSSKTNGLVTFASNPKTQLKQAVIDMMTHVTTHLNKNGGDLDVVLVLDYSGSMSDKIAAVIAGLRDITEYIRTNIQSTGRQVRVGIATFGAPGRERANLQLTVQMPQVANTLDQLLRDYERDQHSVEPGESCYHGLHVAANSFTWRATTRMALVITDEPSHELLTPAFGQTYVDRVMADLRRGGVQTSIYTIVVR